MSVTVLSLWHGAIPAKPSMKQIATLVAERHGLGLEHLVGPETAQRFVLPRHEAMFLIRAENRYSLPQIGKFFGDRNHATVIHGVRRHAARIASKQAAE
jgi:chromosomal replication initiator protein